VHRTAVGAVGEFYDVRQRRFVLNAGFNARSERSIFDRTQNAQVRHSAPTNGNVPKF
jgi:hypothetical protein